MRQGVIKNWSDRGFGFIQSEADGNSNVPAGDTFCHISAFPKGTEPRQGDHVEYDVEPGRQPGKFAACNARILRGNQ